MLPMHTPESVFSPRHAPSWGLLASAGGAVNAIAFVSCSRFVSHVTGAVSRLGMGASGATESLAMESGIIRAGKPSPALPLLVAAALLAALGALGTSGIWGAVDGVVDGPRSVIFLSLLAFAMSLQNATVAACTGLLVRTTHMTGTITDLGVHLATATRTRGASRVLALRHVALRAGLLAGFTAGACAGAWLAGVFAFRALYFPAGAILVAALSSFVCPSEPAVSPAPRYVSVQPPCARACGLESK
jgi:uncharacterized membrane protein YoaK (UPF0700 family)